MTMNFCRTFLVVGSILSYFSGVCAIASSNWTPNEVSVLFPIKKTENIKKLVSLSTIVSAEFFDEVYKTHLPAPGPPNEFSLVAFRVDPCFRDQFADTCKAQLRAVWQRLQTSNGKLEATDEAIHTFHTVSLKSLNEFLNSINQLNKPYKNIFNGSKALAINPVLLTLGLDSTYAMQLNEILSQYLTKENLTRIAVMKLEGLENGWDFFSFDVGPSNTMTPVKIQGTTQNDIRFDNILENLSDLSQAGKVTFDSVDIGQKKFLVADIIKQNGFLRTLFDGSQNVPNNLTFKYLENSNEFDPQLINALKNEVGNIDNTQKNLPGTVDCVSCHVATAIKNSLAGVINGVEIKSFHAFSYFHSESSISDRVRVETDGIVKMLNEQN